jgi:hypothetical protein
MVEEFTFDDRDFALADQNETRKIWAEKYLELGPGTEEAEHFALYKTLQSVLIEKLTNETHSSFVVPFHWIRRWIRARRFDDYPAHSQTFQLEF